MYILWSRQVGDNFREIFSRIKTITASWVFKEAAEFKPKSKSKYRYVGKIVWDITPTQ